MEPTRQTVTAAVFAVVLLISVPLLATPVVGLGGCLIFSWILARQLTAARTFQSSVEATTLTIEPAATTVQVQTEFPITITLERPASAADIQTVVTVSLPPVAEWVAASERTLTLETGDTEASTTLLLSIPTAGRMTVPEPTWVLEDAHGLFRESFDRGPTPTVTVEPHTLQNIHVGRGGSALTAYGQHPTEGSGDGLTPAELREYMGSDPADRIDWKATARLPDTYVQEFEAESDREVTIILDHRSLTGRGTPDSQLTYLREVGLGIVRNAKSVGDPLGFVAVGDKGLTNSIIPSTQQITYTRIREKLLEIEPTPAGPPSSVVDLTHPAASRRLTTELAEDQSRFATVIRSFAEATTAYIETIETDPLYGAIEHAQSTSSSQLTVILTTDTNRRQLRETVRAATGNTTAVLVFMTPAVLFERAELADIETAYERYREFEEFRQELERHSAVLAYEVGPSERIEAVLASKGRQDGGRQTTQEAVNE